MIERKNYLTFMGVYIVLLAYYEMALDSSLGILLPIHAFFAKLGDGGYIVIFVILAALLLILIPLLKSAQEPKVSAIQNKYWIYLTVILTTIALLSILLLSKKVIVSPVPYPPYFLKEFSPIIPPIIVASAVTIFVALTTYMKRFYPYSAIFASALLGVVYVASLTFVTPRFSKEWSLAWLTAYYSVFPIIVIASSWHSEKLGTAYPIALSAVLGVVAGVEIPQGIEGFLEMLALILLSIILILLSGITILILVLAKSKLKSINERLIPSLKKVLLSVLVFLIVSLASFVLIFGYFYRG